MAKKKKKKMDISPGTILIVDWEDIASYDGWIAKEDTGSCALINIKSIGWFLNEDESVLRIVSTMADDSSNVLVIPQSVVRNIWILETK